MADAQTLGDMSPELCKGVERAKQEPEGRCNSLAHLIDVSALARASHRQRADAAVGVDGVTKEAYGQHLKGNLQDLHRRLKTKQYRHQPIRRVPIPKAQGTTRPIGMSAFEDKLVQDALREVLEAMYEQDCLDGSHGFRPRRSAHDAVRTLKRIGDRGEVNWLYEADIMSFFDSLDRTKRKELLGIRVADGSLMRLIGKCVHVGVLDGEAVLEPELGTAQGSVLSPVLGHVYLHYVLDRWFETEGKPRLQGASRKNKRHFPPPPRSALLAGGRRSRRWPRGSMAPPQRHAARRGAARRDLDVQSRLGEAASARVFRIEGLGTAGLEVREGLDLSCAARV